MAKETFIVRTEWKEAIMELKPVEQAIIFQNLFHYHSGHESRVQLPNLSVKLVWKLIEPNLKRNIESYDRRSETSAENGKKGGRPIGPSTPMDENGNRIPNAQYGAHFAYLIYDSETGLHKVGETSDLIKRRLSIKRPKEFLTICAFAVSEPKPCYSWERDTIRKYSGERVSGDWLKINEDQKRVIIDSLSKINLNYPNETYYPNGETYLPNESLSVSDSVSDSVSVPESVSESVPVEKAQSAELDFQSVIPVNQPEPEKPPRSARPPLNLVMPWPTETFISEWAVWKNYKKQQHRFTYKGDISEQAALKDLHEKSGGNEDIAIKIIQQSMSKGWSGLFELKNIPHKNGETTSIRGTSNGAGIIPAGRDYSSAKL